MRLRVSLVFSVISLMTLATGSEDWTGLNVDDVDVKENTVDTGETGNGDFVDPAEFIGYFKHLNLSFSWQHTQCCLSEGLIFSTASF